MELKELNICLVGCGMIGREHIERIQNRIRGAKVVAVCDVFEEGVKKGAEIAGEGTKVYTDFNAAINDPDVNAVVVTTPGAFHKDPVIAAIKAGKPVFSEKPLANTAADCKAETNSAARLSADKFAVKNYNVDASSGSSARIRCTETLNASASSGASVRYAGDCRARIKTSSGGSIREN